ncbi:unnamed protein product [Urochloa decumbens]|uniref:Receptor kinase-like protein Xa21 n=1 Tax=Urochloa decumbens TaxID=240449 RepID=A0ABC9EHC0_9POAL
MLVLLIKPLLRMLALSLFCLATNAAHGDAAYTPHIPYSDQLALMSFKSLVRSDPSRALASWGNISIPMCRWHGVACGLRGHHRGHVVALDLPELNLVGTITPALGNLTYLRRLNLSLNGFQGILEIGSLANLNVLDLGANQFSGTIPSSLGNLSALMLLDASKNNCEGSIPPLQNLSSLIKLQFGMNKLQGTIPSWLGNLSSLVLIDLQCNGLVGQIPESLGTLELFTTLSVSKNNLSGSIPSSLGNLYALTQVYLDNNGLEGTLPSLFFNNLSSLKILDIEYNNLIGTLPPDIGNNLPKLIYFLVSDNIFQGMLPSSLCNASMLQVIETVENYLSGRIPECLGAQQTNLSAVSVAVNLFEATNDADWSFMASLTNCSNLVVLDISENNLHGVLPNSIGNLSTQIEYLSVAYNNITGRITEGISNLINLQTLYMPHNLLIGAIPASLGNLNKLSELYMYNNALSGPLPVTLGNLTQHTRLLLSTNAISGPIPSSLGNCPLEAMDLSHNNLSGPTPKELFSISTLLSFINISHNSLSGSLPSEVGSLENLNGLDLSYNMISDEIPSSIGACQSLEFLNLSGNILQGTIPLSLGNLKGLVELDLSHNNLSGTIPEILARLTGLSILNLAFNKLQGGVPSDGVFLNATKTLITGNDGLCGGIPQLGLPPCPTQTTKKPHRKLVITVSISSAFACVTLVFGVLFALQQRSCLKTKAHLQSSAFSEQYMRVSYAELANATNGFASENLIGAGSFGSVYKGTMRSNDQEIVIAVKVLNLMQRGASQSFVAECETLRCARHRNLVKVLTICSSIDFKGHDLKALVYEFLPNGNLDQWLHKHIIEDGEPKALDLTARLNVAIDVASSLDYLHQHKPTPIIHCDLKPSNVLLDSSMVARVGDFGLARFLHQDIGTSSGWASMRGSIGYTAPEYGLGNEVSTHGDVYSYGILLLEMFTGKRPTDNEFDGAMGLRKYVQMALPDRVCTIMDQQLRMEIENGEPATSNSKLRISCITSILQVGISCSEEMASDRVSIGDALKELQAIKDQVSEAPL